VDHSDSVETAPDKDPAPSRNRHHVIAVDGPAASGKSTIARGLAAALGFRYVNSGALYRAIAYGLLKAGVDICTVDAGVGAAALARIRVECGGDSDRFLLAGEDVSTAIRSREVSAEASRVAQVRQVREKVNQELRRLCAGSNCVVDGRDIGSVVFPDASFKIYLEATPEERARRRLKDYQGMGNTASLEETIRELAERDQQDSTRALAPLRPSEGAIVCNSTHMTPQQVVDHLLSLIRNDLKGRTDA
jgi:cytidylate kinase